MANPMLEIECPCCQAVLKIDVETRAVISHKAPEKPRAVEDLATAVARLKGEGARREEVFRKQFEAEKTHGKVLEKKFEELFKQVKENPDLPPPKREFDFD
jgi:predicted nuclease with TOPRIM domain